jgi:hypothetical protein
MRIETPSIYSNLDIVAISEFNMDDFRSISFMIENDSDNALYNKLISKIDGKCNSLDKVNSLIDARIKYVDENILFNNGESNITVNLNIFKTQLLKNVIDIEETITEGSIQLTLDYPLDFYFSSKEDIIMNCIKYLKIKDKFLNFWVLDKQERYAILEKIPSNIINLIVQFIEKNNKPIILMESRLGLPELSINLFDNSAFSFIKILYNYHTYDDILEILFSLSRRINDVSFLNSRTPRDIILMTKLYTEEVENQNKNDN